MYCKNCGEEIDDRAVVCIKCGVPTEIHPVNDELSGISIAAIICAFFVPLAGFILGLIGMQNAKNQKSKSLAMAGMIVGLVIMLTHGNARIDCNNISRQDTDALRRYEDYTHGKITFEDLKTINHNALVDLCKMAH